ncbi:MAG: type II CRISPR-associated endonuclease Cas1 [Candidatus Anstonellales archaeon]
MILEISEYGCFVAKVGNRVKVMKKRETLFEVSFDKVEAIIIGEGVALSSNFLLSLSKNNVPLFFSSMASTYFLPSTSLSKPTLRLAQMSLSAEKKKKFIYNIIKAKMLGQKQVASLFGFNLQFNLSLNNREPIKEYVQSAMNKEALFAKDYWSNISSIFRGFTRTKIGAEDTLNKCLNYGYGIMRYTIEKAIISVGLDPYMGILHATKDYRTSFVFDLMEPFRPFVDFCAFSYLKDDPEKDFDLIKRDYAKKVVAFFKKENFIFENSLYDFEKATLLFVRRVASFFLEEQDFRVPKVSEWNF